MASSSMELPVNVGYIQFQPGVIRHIEETIVKVSDGSVPKDILLPTSLTVTSTFTGNIAEFSPKGAPTQKGTFCVSASGITTMMKIDVLAGTGRTTTQEVTTCP